MAEKREGGKIRIVNWKYFDETWSKNTEVVEPKYRNDFNKSMAHLRIIMQTDTDEKEKIEKVKKFSQTMKEQDKVKQYPEGFWNDLSMLLPEEKKIGTETASTGHRKTSPVQRSQMETTNQGLDAGSSKNVVNPIQSSSSPMQSRKQAGDSSSQDTKKLMEQIDMLKKDLATERELSRKRGEELSEHQKECKTKEEEMQDLTKRNDELQNRLSKKEKEVNEKQERIFTMEKQLEQSHAAEMKLQGQLQNQSKLYDDLMKKTKEMCEENIKLTKEKKHLEKRYDSTMASVSETMAEEKRKHDSEMQKLIRERDDIRDRFSKLAGAKLSDQNADIADLSDPNRAMKLSEKFGSIYDDEWTNAFEALTDKKIGLPLKDAIVFLLKLLQDSWTFCSDLLGTQMESLHNVFLHPAQDLSKIDPRQNVAGHKDRPRICSKDEKTLREVRRQICVGSSVIEEVKQVFLSDIKSRGKEKTGYQKKHIEECAPYILKCAEICWLMAVHDPPLYMKMDVKQGEKFDPNICSAYSSSGTSIDFLVWPPLLNGKGGGLLAKGVAELLRTVGKKK